MRVLLCRLSCAHLLHAHALAVERLLAPWRHDRQQGHTTTHHDVDHIEVSLREADESRSPSSRDVDHGKDGKKSDASHEGGEGATIVCHGF